MILGGVSEASKRGEALLPGSSSCAGACATTPPLGIAEVDPAPAPTLIPAAVKPASLVVEPLPPEALRVSLAGTSAAPAAFGLPSGVAANSPRRLPAGTSIGPWTTCGLRFRASNWPTVLLLIPPVITGGGGMAAVSLFAVEAEAGVSVSPEARCSGSGNFGSSTAACTRLISPGLRGTSSGTGGGWITDGAGTSGSFTREMFRGALSGAGAITGVANTGKVNLEGERSRAVTGTAAKIGVITARLGSATGCGSNLTLLGSTMVCWRLSGRSGVTTIGCGANFGSPLRATFAGATAL